MAQTINIKGLVSSFEIEPDEFMLPLHEVIINSIQSIEDKIDPKQGTIEIKVLRSKQTTLKSDISEPYAPIEGFEIFDNGIGFIKERFRAFNTAFDDFYIKKGCKGVGRYTVLACFGSMEINSNFFENEKWLNRTFKFDLNKGVYPENDENLQEAVEHNYKTIVKLNNYKKAFQDFITKVRISLEQIAENIIQHCLLYFISNEAPIIQLYNEYNPDKKIILNDLYHEVVTFDKAVKSLKIKNVISPFNLNYVRNFKSKAHSIHLCANKREVGKKTSLSNYIPSFVQALQDSDDIKYHLSVYVTSKFLDEKANNQRNKFALPMKEEEKNIFDEICLNELFQNISENVRSEYSEWIISAEKEKNERIHHYILDPKLPRLQYRHLLDVEGIFNDIPANATDERLEAELHRKVFYLEQKRSKAFEEAFAKKKYDRDEFAEIINKVLKEEAVFSYGKLADLMIRRKSVIKLFRKYLEWRNDENYMLEKDLHNIIFTMGAETKIMPRDYHNLWLIDERLAYHSYTRSDKQIRTDPYINSDSQKETDLTIYDFPWAYSDNPNDINSLVILEFKRPGRDMNNSKDKKLDSQVEEYFELLMKSESKSDKGKFLNIQDNTPKFGYIICDLHKELVDFNIKYNYFKKTPYNTLFKINPELNQYFEVMSYETMVEFAEKRHDAFFKALGIDTL
ncbi:MAG: hypothetical protein JW870_07420 [Candidatus Delongbacteria bacterium]|nr:hypothetical protein [Candidatus Delongbacteria bacterium]